MDIVTIITPPSKSIFIKVKATSIFKDFGIVFLSKVLRDNINNKDALWLSVNESLSKGETIKESDLCNLVLNEIESINQDKVLIIGYPRTENQLELFSNALEKEYTNVKLTGVFSAANKGEENSVQNEALKKSFNSKGRYAILSSFDDFLDDLISK